MRPWASAGSRPPRGTPGSTEPHISLNSGVSGSARELYGETHARSSSRPFSSLSRSLPSSAYEYFHAVRPWYATWLLIKVIWPGACRYS